MAELEKLKPEEKTHKGSELEVYGVCSKIPDTSAKNAIMKMLLDAFLEIWSCVTVNYFKQINSIFPSSL